jgi:hypothetical protein
MSTSMADVLYMLKGFVRLAHIKKEGSFENYTRFIATGELPTADCS